MIKSFKKIFITALLVCSATFAALGVTFIGYDKVSAQDAIKEETLTSFRINEGAEVRAADPDGIRFTTTIDETTGALAAKLQSDGYAVSYGTLLCPTDILGNSELTFGTKSTTSALDIPTEKWAKEGVTYNSVLSGTKGENGEITNMPSDFYNRAISARGYMKATKGSETTYYYTSNVAERSLGYVAAMSVLNGDDTEQLKKYAENAVIAFAKNLRLTADKNTEGALLSNVYKSSLTQPIFTIDGIAAELPNVTVSVADDKIASVTDGVITAKSNGTTQLTAVYNFGGESKTIEGTLTVSDEFKGASDYKILVPSGATKTVLGAAEKFQTIFKEYANVTLPIETETGNEKTSDKYISVGETQLAKNNFALTVTKATASEIKTIENVLFVRGTTDNATLYGVQELLGDITGYEFYLKNTYTVNSAAAQNLPGDKQYVPDIEYNFLDQNSDVSADYAMQMFYDGLGKVNGVNEYLHNSVLILNPDTYYNDNKDWYATSKKYSWATESLIKTNQGKAAELCYTAHGNSAAYEKMLTTVAEKIVTTFKNDASIEKLSFSISDGNYGWCNCSSCTAVGNASDNLLKFLNALCQKVESGLDGDSRQNTFKILTLAYHQTNVAPTKVTSLNKHVEVWFGDSYGDYTKGLNETGSAKNAEIYKNFQGWANVTGDADMLLWVYYSNTKCGFAPYNTINAMRKNYAIAKNADVDYMFNQTIQARSGWTMLKLYLASELEWNANPTDAEWNGWIDSYFTAAYGQGAAKMREWFNAWQSADTSDYKTSDTDPAIHRDIVNSGYFDKSTLNSWINYANAAIAALDKNDKNYNKYFNNIMLEKASPEYLLIEIYDDYGANLVYASEFVATVQTWDIKNVGEVVSIAATLEKYNQALENKTITIETEFFAEKQADGNYSLVITDNNVAAGEYTVTVDGATVVENTAESGKLTVTIGGIELANEGKALTVTATPVDTNKNIVRFANVMAVSKVIRTADDLTVLTTINDNATENITGYYVLGGDIDASEYTTKATGYNWNKGFAGTFDGRGYTIDGITAITCGLFGTIRSGTVKKVNFTNVTLGNGKDNYDALFAGKAAYTTISDVYVSYKNINLYSSVGNLHGLLFSRTTEGWTKWTNVTLDASEFAVDSIFGAELPAFSSEYSAFVNVNVKVKNGSVLGYTTVVKGNKGEKLTELPSGITIDTLPEFEADEEFYAENGVVVLTHEAFMVGDEYTVTANGETIKATVTEDTKLTVSFSGLTVGNSYEVVCESKICKVTFSKVFAATKVIRTADDLTVLTTINDNATENITGYYVLGGDIDASEYTTKATGYHMGGVGFKGVFDGRGYTIDGITAGSCGLFGSIYGGTIKSVNFTNVTLKNQNYTALLAGVCQTLTMSDVNVSYKSINLTVADVYLHGLLFSRVTSYAQKWTNVTVDASAFVIDSIFGAEVNLQHANSKFDNVNIKVKNGSVLGYTTVVKGNKGEKLTELPNGVTVTEL